jgi:hypothetical protein
MVFTKYNKKEAYWLKVINIDVNNKIAESTEFLFFWWEVILGLNLRPRGC